ncbi:hypothetical protein HC928_12905 [bacterium]|nr:hypothetical protein [bacterium]
MAATGEVMGDRSSLRVLANELSDDLVAEVLDCERSGSSASKSSYRLTVRHKEVYDDHREAIQADIRDRERLVAEVQAQTLSKLQQKQ